MEENQAQSRVFYVSIYFKPFRIRTCFYSILKIMDDKKRVENPMPKINIFSRHLFWYVSVAQWQGSL